MPTLGICRVCGANTTGGVHCPDCLRATCPRCEGRGYSDGMECPGFRLVRRDCALCGATGTVDQATLARVRRAETFRSARVFGRGERLRDAAERRGVDLATLSRMERGDLPIPEDWQP